MTYDEITLACEKLSYRDKLRLAQLLVQTARKEEENENPQNRVKAQAKDGSANMDYVVERLLKLKPVKKKSLTNSVKAMFQFQGGIAEPDVNKIISELQRRKHIKIEQNNVSYL